MPLGRQKLFIYHKLCNSLLNPIYQTHILCYRLISCSHLSFQPIILIVFGFLSRKGVLTKYKTWKTPTFKGEEVEESAKKGWEIAMLIWDGNGSKWKNFPSKIGEQ